MAQRNALITYKFNLTLGDAQLVMSILPGTSYFIKWLYKTASSDDIFCGVTISRS